MLNFEVQLFYLSSLFLVKSFEEPLFFSSIYFLPKVTECFIFDLDLAFNMFVNYIANISNKANYKNYMRREEKS